MTNIEQWLRESDEYKLTTRHIKCTSCPVSDRCTATNTGACAEEFKKWALEEVEETDE